ncbi:MAG TPA: ABC transporter substrate-binding protein [Bacteroidia bacterium]|nr:ABC transporter substrate-binding protein [Bacteroidia bacterium]
MVKYAKGFSMKDSGQYKVISLYGPNAGRTPLAEYVLYNSNEPPVQKGENVYRIKTPCRRVAALSSIYAYMVAELHAMDQLVGIDNIDYVNHKAVLDKFRAGELKELARGPEPDLEQIILLHPDVVFSFGMPGQTWVNHPRLRENGIPQVLSFDHLEESPLARAEWLKFFAAFLGKSHEADSVFTAVEKSYLALKDSAAHFKIKPRVLTEILYGELWYVPGGNSFMARLLSDAGATYPWHEDRHSGSLALSFEQVYLRAADADFWINLSGLKSKRELRSIESRYEGFRAFQNGNLFNNNKRVNHKGYSEYWESAMVHPERLLSDLIRIFHASPLKEEDLYYYRKLDEE